MRKIADQTIPESVLPYVLHLLSYHIDFPTSPDCSSESNDNRLKVVVRSIRLVLQALQSSLRNEASNIPYLLKQIHLISQVYCDRIDTSNIGLQFLAGITRSIIQESIKTAENVQVYPGNISLPAELFQLKEDPNESGAPAQILIDRALAAAQKTGKQPRGGKPNPGKILSPVRRVHVAKTSPASMASSGADSKQSEKSSKPKPKPRATAKSKKTKPDSKPPVLPEEEENRGFVDDEEDDREHQGEPDTVAAQSKPSQRKRSSKAATSSRPSPVPEEKTRSLPARRAKAAVSTYKEAEVSEKEINSWDEGAGEAKKSARKRSLDSRTSAGRGVHSSFGEGEDTGEDDQEETLLMAKRRALDESFDSTKKVSSYSIKDILVLEPEEDPSPQAQKSKGKDRERESHANSLDVNKRRDSELDLAAEELEEFVAISTRLPRESAEWDSMLEVRGSDVSGRGSGVGGKKSSKPNPRRSGPVPVSSKTIAMEAQTEDEPVVSLSKRRKFGLQVTENNVAHSQKPSSDDSHPVTEIEGAKGTIAKTSKAAYANTTTNAAREKIKITSKSIVSGKSTRDDKVVSAAVAIGE
eukprot:gene25862-34451_t